MSDNRLISTKLSDNNLAGELVEIGVFETNHKPGIRDFCD